MKLILAIVLEVDKNKVNFVFIENGVFVIIIYLIGGFLNRGIVIFMIGVEDDKFDEVIDFIKKNVLERKEVLKFILLFVL